MADTPRVTLIPAGDREALGVTWRALEAQADGSLFTSWTWLGAVAWRRPLLLRAEAGGRVVALALFGRGRFPSRLHLHQTGDAGMDRVFIEHNGLLVARDAPPGTREACWRALRGRALSVGGVDAATMTGMRDAGLRVGPTLTRAAPFADLSGGRVIEIFSANTRSQVRRARRLYEADGELRAERAGDAATALAWLDRLAVLHQATWVARGKPGAFADPAFGQFHRAVIQAGWPRGEIDVLRVSAGEREVGYLYNFRHRGRVSAYQSGLAYAEDARLKPGMICHVLAMEAARADGVTIYDFLAGDDRYKQSLVKRFGEPGVDARGAGVDADPARLGAKNLARFSVTSCRAWSRSRTSPRARNRA